MMIVRSIRGGDEIITALRLFGATIERDGRDGSE
jgi:hypothetical protein